MSLSKLRRFSLATSLALCCVTAPAIAQDKDAAKKLADQAKATGDQCEQMQLLCRAADADPKNKGYRDDCTAARGVLSRKDDSNVEKAATFLGGGNVASAKRFANFVCKYNVKQYAQAQDILQSINAQETKAEAKNQPPPVAQPQPQPVQAPVVASTPPPTQAPPPQTQPQQAPATQAAVNQPKPNTPTPQQAPPPNNAQNKGVPAPPKPAPEPVAVTVQKLLDQAVRAKTAGNLQDARRGFAEALRLDPGNGAATVGRAEVEARINSDPAEQAKTLAQAIRDFYSFKYQDAESGLTDYLSSTTARSRGAAYFYLGATRLSIQVMETSSQKVETILNNPNVQKSFKQARDEHYQPVEKYVSPLILRAWRGAN
jgi:outer membrane biosynthesis protein TonB